MSIWRELRSLPAGVRVFLIAALVLFNLFAVARVVPVNSMLLENMLATRGDYERNVYRVHRLAVAQAAEPFSHVRNHALFFNRNPALFMLVSELFARAGAMRPVPNQVFAILLWNGGLVFLFLWLRRTFGDVEAIAGTAFVLTTPFLLFWSSSIHHEPYCFLFFNLALYCFARWLDAREQRRWLVGTCIAFFLLCQNYWFYYAGAFLMLLALQVKARQWSWRTSALLALVPVLAAVVTFAQVAYAIGGVSEAAFRLADIAAARTLDRRIEGSKWFPERTFVTQDEFEQYPLIVAERIEDVAGYDARFLLGLLAAALLLAGRERLGRYRWLPLAFLAGMSWYLVMVQHTVLHEFSGMYSWFLWVVIVAIFATELQAALRADIWRKALLALAIPALAYGASVVYLPYLTRYAANIAAGKDTAARPVPRPIFRPPELEPQPADPPKKKRKKKPKAKKPPVVDAGPRG